MATPLNTTAEQVPFCVRQLTINGTLQTFSRQGTSGICPGSISESGNYHCCSYTDTCLGYGICHRTNPTSGRSSFYMSSCNDANYVDDVACPKICIGQARPDIMFDEKARVWRCCGIDQSGRVACDEATADMSGVEFLAPVPGNLMVMRSDETLNGVRLGTATVTATSGVGATGGATSDGGNHGLSGVAMGGIAVGVIVPVVLIGVFAFFFMQRRRAMKRRSNEVRMASMQHEHWHR